PALRRRRIVLERRPGGKRSSSASDVEPEMHHVSLLDDVLLAFETELARLLCALLAFVGDEVLVSDDLGANEPLLEVGVDHAGGLRRRRADADGPRADFLDARGEVSLQAEQL